MNKKWTSLPTEYQECRAYFAWAQTQSLLQEYLIKHVNEGKRSKIGGYLLKLIGLRKGLPDYQLPIANNKWRGLWIEMKTQDEFNKKQKEEQIAWMDKLRAINHYATFAFGANHAIQLTLDYLNDKL
jgi:hypothetical protein